MKECKKCGSKDIMGIEYGYPSKEQYDGISEWSCIKCGYRQGRWSEEELKDGYIESRFNKKGQVKIK